MTVQAEQARTFIEERFTSPLDRSKVRQFSSMLSRQMQLRLSGGAHTQSELSSLGASAGAGLISVSNTHIANDTESMPQMD